MISSPRRREGLLPAVLLLLGVVAAGAVGMAAFAGGPVEVALPVEVDDPACTAASAHWPREVDGQVRAETEPSDPRVAAWGDPAVIARCGMPSLGPTENLCVVVNGVDWVVEDLGDGARLTTFGRKPAIEVLVPKERGPGPQVLPAFADAAKELPRSDLACT